MASAAVILVGAGCASLGDRSQVVTGQHPQSLETEIRIPVRMDYLLYLPDEYAESNRDWPLILFLHGAGERGNDLEKVKIHGPPKLIAGQNKEFPFVIASPQCPQGDWWSSDVQIASLDALLSELISQHRIDRDRVYVTGLSMGGFGTWRLAVEYPERFAAIAPICGKGDPKRAGRIGQLPIWVFHGAKDEAVPIKHSEEMVAALKKSGSDVKFTVYPDAGHDSWTTTYNNPELYEWFLKHRRSKRR